MEHRPIAIPIAALETNIVPSNVWKKYINTKEIVCKKNAEKKIIRKKRRYKKGKEKCIQQKNKHVHRNSRKQARPQKHS
jgi:hypothetical protein